MPVVEGEQRAFQPPQLAQRRGEAVLPRVGGELAPSTWHLQIVGKRDGAMPGDARDYAAMTTPVTSAQVAKPWVRPDRSFAAVSWSRRRGKTLATWS